MFNQVRWLHGLERRSLFQGRRMATYYTVQKKPQTDRELNKVYQEQLKPINSVLSTQNFANKNHHMVNHDELSGEEIYRQFCENLEESTRREKEDKELFDLAIGNIYMYDFLRELKLKGDLEELFDEVILHVYEPKAHRSIAKERTEKILHDTAVEELLAELQAEKRRLMEEMKTTTTTTMQKPSPSSSSSQIVEKEPLLQRLKRELNS